MKMTRHFFISDDLDDLERFEEELEGSGIVTPQIHLLTLNDSDAEHHHHLHRVSALMKQDLVHSTLVGAGFGVCAAALVLAVAHFAGWTQTAAGWIPFIFLALITLGFFTWEGGFLGTQKPNVHFQQFEKALNNGQHVFFVDIEPGQAQILKTHASRHPRVQEAGTGRAAPHWLVFGQHRVKRFLTETWP